MKRTTVKGTNDYLPKEVSIRDYVMSVILKTYQSYGFQRIITPVLEDIENLDKSEGGENLGLIFKVLKRGEKLDKALKSVNSKELADIGLRYDLTLPLSRYYANNKEKLLFPFKCIQIDKVYRAERPQKGRLREFVQCDIDIIGSSSLDSETELILVTAKALSNIGIGDFRIKLNDRRLLKAILQKIGFDAALMDSICITIDKLDKIGLTGIQDELKEKGFPESSIQKLTGILEDRPFHLEKVKNICGEEESIQNLESIIKTLKTIAGDIPVEYDMSLIRGQGYYTGTVFEIEITGFKGAIAGGGRYDNLIGKFINEKVPAVGFSIGFERIVGILLEMGFVVPDKQIKIAFLYEEADFIKAMEAAENMRKAYEIALYGKPKKTGKFIERLKEQGYDGFYIVGQSEEIQYFRSDYLG